VTAQTAPSTNPLGALLPYELRHLIEHLAAAASDDHIHRLLAWHRRDGLRAAPSNAWYEAKQAVGEDLGYEADIELAWRLADEAFIRADTRARGPALGLQVRCTVAGRRCETSSRSSSDASSWTLEIRSAGVTGAGPA
jgi:hypothetical protein